VLKRRTGNSSEDESIDTDGGYNSGNCSASGCRNWKDLKSKQAGEEIAQRNTQSFMADFLSNDEVGEEDRFDKERERECRRRNVKLMDAGMKLRPHGHHQERGKQKTL
jgi:hypothetical protein